LFLTFDLVLFGSFTRLTDSGLGCPDWPGCYGSASPIGAVAHIDAAQTAMPTGPVTHNKAWIEMIHRYLATAVGFLILVLALSSTWQRWKGQFAFNGAWQVKPFWAWLTLFWVCMQGAFGALTVTLKLSPAIVTLHLQIAMGAWVSTNYAVLACTGFPDCNGQWWPAWNFQGFEIWRGLGMDSKGQYLPMEALVSIHFVHRLMALFVFAFAGIMLWQFIKSDVLPGLTRILLALLTLQLITGLSNVVLDWPLLAAVAHTGGAGALMMTLTYMLSRSKLQR
jgi:cytochrome c oxidase assembly protein subunit 15